jgi:guanosine-3',5'-bis(diphosphate) 3'-pyrophosphohydrolase
MDIVDRAFYFATAAHAAIDQRRKYTGEDYIVHPIEVVDILKDYHYDEFGEKFDLVLSAAYMHDLIEDTAITRSFILNHFGWEISELVWELTNESTPNDGNRAQRKKKDLEKTKTISFEAKMIRLADIHSNCRTIFQYDKDFAKVYIQEKFDILELMPECQHTPLFKIVEDGLNTMIKELYLNPFE